MDKPVCYLPESLAGFYKKFDVSGKSPEDIKQAAAVIISVYLDYRCLPTDLNDMEPDDPNGLGLFELICIKLMSNPQFARRAREIYAKLDTIYDIIVKKKKNALDVMVATFKLDELEYYGY